MHAACSHKKASMFRLFHQYTCNKVSRKSGRCRRFFIAHVIGRRIMMQRSTTLFVEQSLRQKCVVGRLPMLSRAANPPCLAAPLALGVSDRRTRVPERSVRPDGDASWVIPFVPSVPERHTRRGVIFDIVGVMTVLLQVTALSPLNHEWERPMRTTARGEGAAREGPLHGTGSWGGRS